MTIQNLVAAALLAQLIFIVILVLTSQISGYMYSALERSDDKRDRLSAYSYLLLMLTVLSFGALFVSDVMADLWKPFFGNPEGAGISASTAISIMLLADIFTLGFLVLSSGGARVSPFVSGLFFVPTLAIFLREPVNWIIVYATLSGATLTVLSIWSFSWDEDVRERRLGNKVATWFMTVSCLALGTWIGILTRPLPLE